MFYYLQGPIAILEPGMAVVDCGGVGYACSVTAYTAAQLKLNQTARLYIHENIREDAFDLFGFASREELRCFQLLLGVNGVGPKAALAILSSGGPQRHRQHRGDGPLRLTCHGEPVMSLQKLTASQIPVCRFCQKLRLVPLPDSLTLFCPLEQGGSTS